MTVAVTFTETVKVEGATYTVDDSPYDLDDNLAARFIHRGWATGTISGTVSVTMSAAYKSGGVIYAQGETYEIAQPLAGFLIEEGKATPATVPDVAPSNVAIPITVTQPSVSDPNAAGDMDAVATAWNKSGDSLTDQLVVFGLPAGQSNWSQDDGFQLFADDGGSIGSEVAAYQIDNTFSDRQPKRRHTFVALVDSFTAGQVKKYHGVNTSGSPPSGVPVEIEDILALDAFDNGGVKVTCSIGGTSYQWRLDDALAGSTTYDKTDYTRWINADDGLDWRYGPVLRSIIVSGPLRAVSGGAPHASGDGMHVKAELWAWKGDPGAVDEENPILGLMARITLENVSGSTTYTISGLNIERAADLDDGTLTDEDDTDWITGENIEYDFTGQDTAAWGGAGAAKTVMIGQKPILGLAGSHTIVEGEPTTNVLSRAFSSAKLIPYDARSFSEVTHSMTNLNNLPQLPFKKNVAPGDTGRYGDIQLNMPGTGGRGDIGLVPLWDINGLIRPDSDGLRKIIKNAECQVAYRYTGHARHPDDGFKHKEPASGATVRTTSKTTGDPYNYDLDHAPETAYVAYLQTGFHDYYDAAVGFITRIAHEFVGLNGPNPGGGANSTPYGEAGKTTWDNENTSSGNRYWFFYQERGVAWGLARIGHVSLITPDRQTSTDIFGPKKSAFFQVIENIGIRGAACVSRGHSIGQPEGGGKVRFTFLGHNVFSHNPWQMDYQIMALANYKRLGLDDANIATIRNHFKDAYVWQINNIPGGWTWLVGAFQERLANIGSGDGTSQITDYLDYYEDFNLRRPTSGAEVAQLRRFIDGVTCTLSATKGDSITAEFSANIFDMEVDPEWLVGKWFAERTGSLYGPGYATIVSVDAANQLTLKTEDLVVDAEIASATSTSFTVPSGSPLTQAVGMNAAGFAVSYPQNGAEVTITSGTGSGQTRAITAINTDTRVATIGSAWSTTPDATSKFKTHGTFSTTSLAANTWSLPLPPADYEGGHKRELGSPFFDGNYVGGKRGMLAILADNGDEDAIAAFATFKSHYTSLSGLEGAWVYYEVEP